MLEVVSVAPIFTHPSPDSWELEGVALALQDVVAIPRVPRICACLWNIGLDTTPYCSNSIQPIHNHFYRCYTTHWTVTTYQCTILRPTFLVSFPRSQFIVTTTATSRPQARASVISVPFHPTTQKPETFHLLRRCAWQWGVCVRTCVFP